MTDQPEPFPGVFPGTLGVPPDVPRLVATSDLVCIGRVFERRDDGSIFYLVNSEALEFRRIVIRVDIERVVEGLAEEQIQVDLLGLDEPSGLPSPTEGERVLFFLVSRGAHYTLTDLVTGAVALDRSDAEEVLAQLDW